jgi:hypothetical protein
VVEETVVGEDAPLEEMQPEPPPPVDATKVLAGAAGGAILGAVVWGIIAKVTGYEVGWIAWGVGFAAGGGAAMMGGRGVPSAALGAVFALLGIVGGKYLAAHLYLSEFAATLPASMGVDRSAYDELLVDSRDWVALKSQDQIPEFMATHRYTEDPDPATVTAEQAKEFSATTGKELADFAANPTDFDTWAIAQEAKNAELIGQITSSGTLTTAVKENLGPMDILFAVLGIITGWSKGMGGGDVPAPVASVEKSRLRRGSKERGGKADPGPF